MAPIRLHSIACAVAAAFAPAAVLAQSTDPAPPAAAASAPDGEKEATLPTMRVHIEAQRETATSPVIGYRAKRSGTATKTDTPLNEVPQSISVISADQVKDQASQTMQDVLRYTAGVRNEMYGLDNRGDWFTLRGGSEGSVLLDGLRVPLTGWYGVVRQEPYAFERIEVLRGPASVIAGQNGPGGVVNLVSKRPQAEAMREVAVQLGTDNHKQLSLDLTGPLNADGTLLYRLVALGKDSGTQVNHADDRRTFVAPSLTWRIAPGTQLTAFAEYQKDHSGNVNGFFPIEGTLRPGPHGFIPYDTFIGEPAWDRYGGERERVGWRFEHKLNADWTLRQGFRHDRIEGAMRTMYADWAGGFSDATGAADPNGTYLNRYWYATDDKARITNADLLLEGKLAWGRTRHTVLLGIDAMRNDSDQRTWTDTLATPLDVYNPVYGTFPEPDWYSLDTDLNKNRVRNTGVLLQDQIKFDDRWVVVAGLRYDRARTTSETFHADGSITPPAPQRDSATSKNLGMVYLADGGWSPYVGYSESFEPVAGAAFDGTPFEPKRGKQLEAGVKWSPPGSRFSGAAAVYQLKEKNRLTNDPTHINESIQLGEVTVKGVELELQANLRSWELLGSYTYMDASQSGAGDDPIYLGKQLAGIPKHQAALWAVHRFAALPGLRAGGGVRYVGKTSDGADGTITPAVTLLDLMMSYDTGPWRLALNVTNATDKTYIATCLERGDCWFGTKRKAIATLAYRW